MNAPYTAEAVANEFLLLAGLGQICHLKLQKLVYYAHAWHLALFDAPLISDRVEAWEYGPIIGALFEHFREYGGEPIHQLALAIGDDWHPVAPRINGDDTHTLRFIRQTWGVFGGLTTRQLSHMSQAEHEPWFHTKSRRRGMAIPNHLIKEFFQPLPQSAGRNAAIR